MSRNRDLATAFGVMAVAWSILGLATGFAAQYFPTSLRLVVWAVNVLIIIFIISLVRSTARWPALGVGIIGIIEVISDVIAIITLPPAATFGPAVGLVFAALFALFALRTYFEKPLP